MTNNGFPTWQIRYSFSTRGGNDWRSTCLREVTQLEVAQMTNETRRVGKLGKTNILENHSWKRLLKWNYCECSVCVSRKQEPEIKKKSQQDNNNKTQKLKNKNNDSNESKLELTFKLFPDCNLACQQLILQLRPIKALNWSVPFKSLVCVFFELLPVIYSLDILSFLLYIWPK